MFKKKQYLFLNYYNDIGCDKNTITHSRISEEKDNNAIGSKVIKCDNLNNMLKDIDKYILLKIDVDGAEPDILKGSTKILDKVGIVIIESWTSRISNFINKNNFELFDIVDICYIRGKLSQVDLVFINKDINNIKEMDPVNNYKDVFKTPGNYKEFIC